MASPRRRRPSPRMPRSPRRAAPGRRDSGRGHSGRSRSRSTGRRPQRRESKGSEAAQKDDASREVKEAVKTARDKAKEQMEKEREKARLKTEKRNTANKDREVQRLQQRELQREQAAVALTQSVNDNASARPRGDEANRPAESLKIAPQTEAEQKAEAAQAAAVAAAARSIEQKRRKPQATPPPAVEEEQIRKLFELLDAKNKGEVSQRDVLLALRKHHPIRQLFGLVGSGEAAALQQRIEGIQEAFESGSGLGEVAPLFNALKEASGTNGSFHFEAFSSACQRRLQCNVVAAVESLPREHAQGEAFTPTKYWSVVPPGAACPVGLEYRMDMETGQTFARLR